MSASAMPCDTSHRPAWPELLDRAAAIVHGYDTLVTLRQLFYRLVAAQFWNDDAYKAALHREATERRTLNR